jgi:hypothetical protein
VAVPTYQSFHRYSKQFGGRRVSPQDSQVGVQDRYAVGDGIEGPFPILFCTPGFQLLLTEFPGDVRQLALCRPIYERVPGWSRPTHGVRSYDELPAEARAYVTRLEALTGVPVGIISTGSDRDETIVRETSVVGQWLGQKA